MSPVSPLYHVAVGAARAVAPILAVGGSKLARGLAGRRHAHEALATWGETERDPYRPATWVHAPSVGEALQAGAVIGALRTRRPAVQVVFTHFSPSAEGIGPRIGAQVAAYLPWDSSAAVGRALDGVRPDLLVFTKTEVWPVLVDEAVRRGVNVALVAAYVRPGAGRLRWPARALLRSTWQRLSLACACTEEDAVGLVALGVPSSVVHVTGDPGVDGAAERAGQADRLAPSLAPFHADARPTVVAGSTWPRDEAVLMPALQQVRRAVPDVRVIVAAHEPTAGRVRDLLRGLAAAGWRSRTLADVQSIGSAEGVDAVVVERVGVLAQLYTVGDAAYVGGGFGRHGLHSVLEPAAAGVPVVFGPRHGRSAAAAALEAVGGACVVSDAPGLARALAVWLTDPDARARAGKRAFIYIDGHRGAAARTAALLDPLLRSPPSA
jgi:3-deoxy-D-manno-octulosonic-acid transferase